MSQKILLVEGESDRIFFQEMCKLLGLDIEVKVNTPVNYGAKKDGKIAAFNLLVALMAQLADGSITHLAMVVDADFPDDGWGYIKTIEHIKNKIRNSGYDNPVVKHDGLSFPHSDGLSNFGLWVMPDNQSEGMLEDWITMAVKNEELLLLKHAMNIVKSLPQPQKFKVIHRSKAEIATWMAWQRIPGQGLHTVIGENLISLESKPIMQLTNWLQHIYT